VGYFLHFVGMLFLFLGAFTASALTVAYGTWIFWVGYVGAFATVVAIKVKDRPANSSGEGWEVKKKNENVDSN